MIACMQNCCQPLHKVQQMKVAGPEQLLRARFSAYVKKGAAAAGGGGLAVQQERACKHTCMHAWGHP